MKHVLLAAASVFALGSSVSVAFAQTGDWTGGYIGGQIGYASARDQSNETILFDNNLDGQFNNSVLTAAGANAFSPGFCGGSAQTSLPNSGCTKDDSGLDYGVRAGYDWQMASGVVVGVVGELSMPDVNDSVAAFSTTPAYYTMTREMDGMAAIRARAGFAVDRFLPYVTGGYARAKIDQRFSTSNTANTFVTRGDDSASGYQVGAGVETKVWNNWSVGAEYLFTSLKDDGYRVRAQGPAPATNPFIITNASGTDFARSNDKFEFHSVRMTVAYRF